MAHKSMEMMKNVDQAKVERAHELIEALEATMEKGEFPTETQVKKLNDLF